MNEEEKWKRIFELAMRADQERAQMRTLREVMRDLPGQSVFLVDAKMRIRACGGEILAKHPLWSISALNGKNIEKVFNGQGLKGEQGLEILSGYRRALAGQKTQVSHSRHGVTYISRFWPIMRGTRVVYAMACTFIEGSDPVPVDLRAIEESILKNQ